MLFSCTTKFEIEEEQLKLAREMGVHDEGETDDITPKTDDVEPISDKEDNEEEREEEEVRLSLVRAGKRRKSTVSEDENDQIGEDNDDDDGLPIMQSQIRESGRVRKRPKGIEGFEVQFY